MYRLWSLKTGERTSIEEVLEKTAPDIVFFGEVHEAPGILEAELDFYKAILDKCPRAILFLEMFNYKQQRLLDLYLEGRMPWSILLEEYSRSREGFDLDYYRHLVDYARLKNTRVYGAMPPREIASIIARKGLERASREIESLVDASRVDYDIPGYKHRFYEMIPKEGPMTRLDPEKLLQAQAFKDETIAYIVASKTAQERIDCKPRALVVTGYGHVEHVGTVPQRLAKYSKYTWIVVTSRIIEPKDEKILVEAKRRDYLSIAEALVTTNIA